MGLITKEVEVGLSGKNIQHFEDLGYEIPRRIDKWGQITVPKGIKILVKVEHLINNSIVEVNVKCDNKNCKDPYLKMTWYNYKKYVKKDGKYYCKKCKSLESIKKTNETKLKKSKSFEQWCLENNRQDILKRWDYELNDKKPSEILYGTNKKYYFKCPRGIHKSELKNIGSFTSGQEGSMYCFQCNSFAQWGIDNIGEDFLEKYWDYEKNKLNPWKISSGSRHSIIWIKCQEKDYHGSYKVTCNNFINQSRCPYCCNYHGKVHFFDSLGSLYPQVLGIWSSKNKETPYKYAPTCNKKVWWKCLEGKHEDYKRRISDSNHCDFRCPECVRERNESFLQEKVRLYLNELGYTILHEHNCSILPKNPKIKGTNNTLPYDNEIKELKLIIEIMGLQHEKITSWHKSLAKNKGTTPEYELYMIQVRDRYKRMYAKSKGYYYLDIWYYHDDKEETWKQLIDKKINNILNFKEVI